MEVFLSKDIGLLDLDNLNSNKTIASKQIIKIFFDKLVPLLKSLRNELISIQIKVCSFPFTELFSMPFSQKAFIFGL